MTATRRLSIVQVSTCDAGGGAERIAADLHRLACEHGMRSTLAVGHRFAQDSDAVLIPNDANRSTWARAVLELVPPLPAFHTATSPAGVVLRRTLKTIAEPRRAWRRSRGFEDFEYPGTVHIPDLGTDLADVVHLHNLHGGYFDLRQLPIISAKVPTVITPHDTWLAAGHCAYSLDCDRWLTGCGSCPRPWVLPAIPRDKSAENWNLKRDIYRRSRIHVAAPSRWVLGQLERSIFADAIASSRVIPNGVDLSVFRPGDQVASRARLGLPADATILVFSSASETNPYKDMATIVEALPSIVAGSSGRDVLLVALGNHKAQVSSLDARVLAIPYLRNPADVAEYLRAADLCIHMACAENHPLAVIEALACGTPVIASDVGGVGEIIMDGVSGALVPSADADALAATVSALIADDTRRATMATAAAADAAARFDLCRMATEYFDLYATIAHDKEALT